MSETSLGRREGAVTTFKAVVTAASQVRLWVCGTTMKKGVVENGACGEVWDGWEHLGKEAILIGTEQKVGSKVTSSRKKKKKISKFQELVCVIHSSDSTYDLLH